MLRVYCHYSSSSFSRTIVGSQDAHTHMLCLDSGIYLYSLCIEILVTINFFTTLIIRILLLLIGGSFGGLHVMPPRILRAKLKKTEKSYKFSQKSETFNHQFNIFNRNSRWICYLSNKLPTSAIMKNNVN
jgi:hypothetical protein